MDALERDAQVQRVFAAQATPVVLDKGLVQQVPALSRVPRYVAEFLLAREPLPYSALARVADYVATHHAAPEDRGQWLHRLVRDNALRLLDEVSVEVDVTHGLYLARLPSLDLRVVVDLDVVEAHPALFAGGLWGLCDLRREPAPASDDGGYIVRLAGFHPVQVRARIEPFVESRYYFTTADWIDLLITSAGYDPDTIVEDCSDEAAALRRKLLLLCRLAPAVEPRLHLLELGPRNTGKTYLLRSLSGRVFVLSGARGTPASLFVNLVSRTPGVLVTRSVVVFDEVARLNLGSSETLATMKDFLESGTFTRGALAYTSACSAVFLGNIDVDGGVPARRYRSLVDPLPVELRDAAFLDRLHGYLPGWEIPKMRPASFANGVGFISDYFGEALVRLRDLPFERHFRTLLGDRDIRPDMTQRDRVSVERVARAVLKMVFPHGKADGVGDADVVHTILGIAGELRQRVHDALVVLAPGEYHERTIGFAGIEPSAAAADLWRKARLQIGPRLSTAAGAAYYLDIGAEGMDGGGELRAIEVAVLPTPGLRIHGQPSVGRVVRMTYDYMKAHLSLLALPTTWLDERGLAVHVEDGVRDADALALPLLLAMASALRKAEADKPWVALGAATLHGRLEAPFDVAARLRTLPAGVRLAAPADGGPTPELADVRLVDDLATVLREL